MKYFCLLFLIHISILAYSQSQFDLGFKQGWPQGYCHNDYGCIAPIPPIAPLPSVNESSTSYQDGYNRGFQMGLDAKRSSGNNNSTGYRQVVPPAQWKAPISLDLLIAGEQYKSNQAQKVADNVTNNMNIIWNAINRLNGFNSDLARLYNNKFKKLMIDLNTYSLEDISNNYTNIQSTLQTLFNSVQEDVSHYCNESAKSYKGSSNNPNYSKQEIHPNYYKMAADYLKEQKNAEALDAMNKGIEFDPNNSQAYAYRGFIYLYKFQNYDEAIKDYTKAIQLKPSEKTFYYDCAKAQFRLNKYLDALKNLTECIKLDPDYLDAYFDRGICRSELGDRIGSIKDYDEIIKRETQVKPTNRFSIGTVYNNKAYSLSELKKYDEALPIVNKAIELSPNEYYIWDTRGEIYYLKGEYKKCVKDMTEAIRLYDNKLSKAQSIGGGGANNSYYCRGLSEIMLGKKDEGCQDLSKAGELGKEKAFEKIKENCK